MLNWACLSGVVLDEPELVYPPGEDPVIIFVMGIWSGQRKNGTVKVECRAPVATSAAKLVHQGDRVVLLGFLYATDYQNEEGHQVNEVTIRPLGLELINRQFAPEEK